LNKVIIYIFLIFFGDCYGFMDFLVYLMHFSKKMFWIVEDWISNYKIDGSENDFIEKKINVVKLYFDIVRFKEINQNILIFWFSYQFDFHW
jgi:hypothetical protein